MFCRRDVLDGNRNDAVGISRDRYGNDRQCAAPVRHLAIFNLPPNICPTECIDAWPTIRSRSLTQCHQCSCPRPMRPFINAARHPVWRQSETSRSSPDWPRMAGAAQSSVASLVFHALSRCAEAVPASRLPRLMSNDPKSISKILFFFCRSQFSCTHRVTRSRRE